MVMVRNATAKDIPALSRKLLQLLNNKNSKVYQDNITKFGIPEEFVRKAFAEETLLKTVESEKATFYLALEDEEIIGFAQTIQQDVSTTELDRIIIFPDHARKGIGTQLLNQAVIDQKRRGINSIIVNAGKEETHAKRFYEKNSFKMVKETTVQTPWGKKLELATYQLQL